MTRKKFILDKNQETLAIFDGFHDIWINYHVTKHVILGYKREGYDGILKIEEDDIKKIRSEQINNLKCNVSKEPKIAVTCKICKYKTKCSELIKPLVHSYRKLILDGVIKDREKPRHAHYDSKKSPRSSRIVNNLLFIDKVGTNIICKKEKKFYTVRTCYRKNPFY